MSDKKQEHWPIKLLARHSQDFMTWGCEGCNEVFPTKKEFNKHVIVDSKKPVFQNRTTRDSMLALGECDTND